MTWFDSMSREQIVTIIVPIVLIAIMYSIFQLLAHIFGATAAWYGGLVIYWLLWGLAYPLLVLGKDAVLELIRPARFDVIALLLALIPVLFAAIGRYQYGVQYEKSSALIGIALLVTAFGNGLFEEIFWRGMYLRQFPSQFLLVVVWPSIMFAIWHYAPGTVSGSGDVVRLMAGAALYGLFLGYLAYRTDTIFWGIISHTVAGTIMVI